MKTAPALLYPLAAVAVLCAALLTLHVALSAPAAKERQARRTAELADIHTMAAERLPVLQRLQSLPSDGDRVSAVSALARQTLGDGVATVNEGEPIALAPLPATAHTLTVNVPAAPYARMAEFLDALPSLTPPPHVQSATFLSGTDPGSGSATLTLESL